jgi:hypothetical protein
LLLLPAGEAEVEILSKPGRGIPRRRKEGKLSRPGSGCESSGERAAGGGGESSGGTGDAGGRLGMQMSFFGRL